MDFFRVLAILSKKINAGLSGMCEKWPLWAKFLGPFGPQIGPK